MMLTDKYAYSSSLSRVSPEAKMLFSLVPLAICILFNSIALSLVTIVIMAVATVKFGKMSLSRYIGFILVPLGFMVIGTLTILINRFEPGHALLMGLQVGQYAYGIDEASLNLSLKLVLRALGAVSCMYFLSLNTPLSDLFQVLGRTRLPQIIVTLMELIYRYIFVLLEEVERMIIAKDSRLGNINFKTSLSSLGEIISMLFIRAYQRSERIYAGLESRGYNGQFKTMNEEYTYSKNMYTASVVVIILLLCAGAAERFFYI